MQTQQKKAPMSAAKRRVLAGLAILALSYVGAAPFVYPQLLSQKTEAADVVSEELPAETELSTEPEAETLGDLQSESIAPTEAAAPVPLEFVTSGADYFDDALFIGDSRMVGISMFGKMPNADFFCTAGLSSRGILGGTRIKGMCLDDYLNNKQYGKVYVMLGINESGDLDAYKQNITTLFAHIRETQPDALIFMMANLHVSAAVSAARPSIGNDHLNTCNRYCEELCDGQTSFYIDVNPLFDDENHCMPASKSGDGIHPGGMDYSRWSEWLFTQTITEESRPNAGHSFQEALNTVMDGGYAMRSGWAEQGLFLCYIQPTVAIDGDENDFACIAVRTQDGRLLPWEPTQEDLLATDWILPQKPPQLPEDPTEDASEETTVDTTEVPA